MASSLPVFARLLDAEGRPDRAVCLAAAASNLKRTIGAAALPEVPPTVPWLDTARERLGPKSAAAACAKGEQLGLEEAVAYALEPVTAPARATADALTAREHEVATLVARGKSNREIAATLVIAERTAETHVEHILSKLAFSSRSQIAAWMVERELTAQPR